MRNDSRSFPEDIHGALERVSQTPQNNTDVDRAAIGGSRFYSNPDGKTTSTRIVLTVRR